MRKGPNLKDILSQNDRKGTYNVEECASFYKMAPDKTVVIDTLLSQEILKDRFSVVLYCHGDSLENVKRFCTRSALSQVRIQFKIMRKL